MHVRLTNCEADMKKGKSGGILRSMSYMTASLILFIAAVVITAYLMIRAVVSGGSLTALEGILGIIALLFSVSGFVVPLYGHFIVRIDSKADWRIGAALNGILMLFLVFLYFLGIQ